MSARLTERYQDDLLGVFSCNEREAITGTLPRRVNCPHCQAPVVWGPESPFRPFCSERCRQIDLGAWANGDYCVPGHAEPADFTTSSVPPATPHE